MKITRCVSSIRRAVLMGAAASLVAGAFAAQAQPAGYPNKPIRFVVPYAAGGLPDTVARIVAQRLGDRVGQSVIVDNRPGANGGVAAGVLASAPADGYQFLVTDGSMLSINPLIYSKLTYDPQKDFVPVALVARAPLFLAVHPKVPVNTLDEFIAYARARPGQVNYGSSGIGSTHHLTIEAMKAALGLDMVHVPFKGTGQSVPALVGGQVEALMSAYPSLSGFVKDGRVRMLAANSEQRSAQAPDLPAIAERIPGFDFAPIVGVLAPVGTPPEIVQKIASEVSAIAKLPDAIQAMKTAGIDPIGGGSAEYAKAIGEENARMARAIQTAGMKRE
ncbi:MAG: tripartite tricarboxylate transporter substrate binding protein [Burkholderiales bacterium]|nr:tripartite tricarboxylate transporter substrate binding protein [Burkholderiales bacterium]MCC7114059.1 tripartite tricarboxylate transporter substrate binding protein [Burkholderiales bacterium]